MVDTPKPAAPKPAAPTPPKPAAAAPTTPPPTAGTPVKGKKLKVHNFQHYGVLNPAGTVNTPVLKKMMDHVVGQVESGHYRYEHPKETPLTDGRTGTHVEFDYVEVDPKVPAADHTL